MNNISIGHTIWITIIALSITTNVQADVYSNKITDINLETDINKKDLDLLTQKIENNTTKSEKIFEKIKKQQVQVDALIKKSEKLKDKMQKRKSVLVKQVKKIQENGEGLNYVDFIVNSESVTDAIARVRGVSKITSENRKMFEKQKKDKENVEKSKEKINEIMNDQKDDIVKMERNSIDLKEQMAIKKAVLSKLAMEKKSIKNQKEKDIAEKKAADELKNAKKISEEAQRQREINEYASKKEPNEKKDDTIDNSIASEKELKKDTQENTQPDSEKVPDQTGSGYLRPTSAPISSSYGAREGLDASGFHKGTDFGGESGSPIYASKSGTVVIAQNDGVPVSGYGKATLIQHDNGNFTLYAHQSSQSVKVGDKVEQGQIIGGMGSTGQSTGTHLHFEIRTSMYGGEGNLLNPELFF